MQMIHFRILIGLCCLIGCKPEVPNIDFPYDAKSPCVMELRITADDRHSAIVGWARKQQAQETEDKKPWSELVIAPESKHPVARWVAVDHKAEPNFKLDPKIVARETPTVPAVMQVLVILDPYNVTSDYVTQARPGADEQGRPAVFFSLTGKGAERFEKLTSSNLPQNGEYRQLGIIVENVIHSAPRINNVISDHGQISGNFTMKEAEHIAETMMARPAPTK